MQDTLEDYLKLTKNAKQDGPLKISREMVVTAQLKKDCEARAMKIVEFSIEGKLRPEVFTKCLPFINQGHYQDIVEERAITKLCGYSICGKRIPDMPKKQYFISTKSNKVYDITERKNFCSNFCYKASLHIKKQIDNSPLWLRKLEDIPEYKLLNSSEGGLPGEYIDQGVVKPVEEEVSFTSINTFAQASLGDISQGNKIKKTRGFKKSSQLKSTMQTIKESVMEEEVTLSETSSRTKPKKAAKHKRHPIVSLPSIEENEEKLQICNPIPNINEPKLDKPCENSSNNKLNAKHDDTSIKIKKKPVSKIPDIEDIVKNAVRDWTTLETCIFIHGEQKVRQVLNERKLSDVFDELHVQELQREQQMRYVEICQRLQLQEMADDKFDNVLVGGNKLKPLPDFKKLKEDTKELKVKVRAFYNGTMYEQDDKNFPTAPTDDEKPDEEGPPAVLPPVDVHSQRLLRRRIFLNSLSKAVQQLLQALSAPYSAVLSDVQALVKTFNLKADNITFKPLVWTYVALVLLDLLALRDGALRELLDEPRSQEYVRVLVDVLPSKKKFLGDVLRHVRDIDTFAERYITEKDSNDV